MKDGVGYTYLTIADYAISQLKGHSSYIVAQRSAAKTNG